MLDHVAPPSVVFVTKMGSTRRDRLKRAVETLRKLDIRIVGVACNWTATVGDYYLPAEKSRAHRPLNGLHLSRRLNKSSQARGGSRYEGVEQDSH